MEKNGKCRTDGYLLESEEGALVSVHLIIGRKHKVLQSFVARQTHPRDTIVCPTFPKWTVRITALVQCLQLSGCEFANVHNPGLELARCSSVPNAQAK